MTQRSTSFAPSQRRRDPAACTDPVVGNILSGWRFDISGLSPAMRTDYETHLNECLNCRRRQRLARSIDLLLITVSTLSTIAFLLAAVVIHRVEMIAHVGSFHVEVYHTAVAISLQAVAIAGIAFSILTWLLVAVATPLPSLVGSFVGDRLPADLRERFLKRAA